MKLYHITPNRNLKNIKKYGIAIFFDDIYLTDYNYIDFWIEALISDNWQKSKKWAILEINISIKDLIKIEYNVNNKILQARYNKGSIKNFKIKEIR